MSDRSAAPSIALILPVRDHGPAYEQALDSIAAAFKRVKNIAKEVPPVTEVLQKRLTEPAELALVNALPRLESAFRGPPASRSRAASACRRSGSCVPAISCSRGVFGAAGWSTSATSRSTSGTAG